MKWENNINTFNILIADDHEIIHRGLKDLISDFWKDVEIHGVSSIEEILIERKQSPKLIIVDVNLSMGSGQTVLYKIKLVHKTAKILVFSSLNERIFAIPLLKAGATGFLSKSAGESEIVTAITSILAGGRYISRSIKENVLNKMFDNGMYNSSVTLSRRELEVASLLKSGIGILEISKRLNLQMSTVSIYKSRVFQKLKVNSIIELTQKMNGSH